jgi:hypothetical protein
MERVACPYWKTLGHNFFLERDRYFLLEMDRYIFQ